MGEAQILREQIRREKCAVCRATTSKRTPRSHIRVMQWRSKCSTLSKVPHRGHRLSSQYGSIFPMSAYPGRSRAMMRSRIPPGGRQRSQTRRSAGCRALYHAAAAVARSSAICAARIRSRRRQRKSACMFDLVRRCVERAPRGKRHRVGGDRGGFSWWPATENLLVHAAPELKESRWAKRVSLARGPLTSRHRTDYDHICGS